MKLAADMKVSKAVGCAMEEEDFITKMVGITKDSGKTTKWTAMANSTTREVSWPTKANGLKTSSTG